MRRMSWPPACGPAAVENAPLTISAKAPATLRRASHANPRGNGRRRPRREAREERRREAGRDDGDEEVAHHEQRVEVEEHRHGARAGSAPNVSSATPPGETARDAIADLPRRQVGEHRGDDPRERDRAVRELDHRVVVEGRHGPALAERPVRAAEARAREAHERARGDVEEHREHEQARDQREPLRVVRDHTAPGALREPGRSRQRSSHREQLVWLVGGWGGGGGGGGGLASSALRSGKSLGVRTLRWTTER